MSGCFEGVDARGGCDERGVEGGSKKTPHNGWLWWLQMVWLHHYHLFVPHCTVAVCVVVVILLMVVVVVVVVEVDFVAVISVGFVGVFVEKVVDGEDGGFADVVVVDGDVVGRVAGVDSPQVRISHNASDNSASTTSTTTTNTPNNHTTTANNTTTFTTTCNTTITTTNSSSSSSTTSNSCSSSCSSSSSSSSSGGRKTERLVEEVGLGGEDPGHVVVVFHFHVALVRVARLEALLTHVTPEWSLTRVSAQVLLGGREGMRGC